MARQRMILSLNEKLHGVLKELSEVSGMPASTFVVELLDASIPQFESLIKTFQLVKEDRFAALDNIQTQISKSIKVGVDVQLDIDKDKKKLRKGKKTKKE